MAKMKKCACCLRRIFGWLLIVLGGLLGVSSAVCALAALFGGMELDSKTASWWELSPMFW